MKRLSTVLILLVAAAGYMASGKTLPASPDVTSTGTAAAAAVNSSNVTTTGMILAYPA